MARNNIADTSVVHSLGRPEWLQDPKAQGSTSIAHEEYYGKRKYVQDWFYANSFQTSILESLRGEGGSSPNSFIQSYTLAGEELPDDGRGSIVHSNTVTFTVVSRLTPGKNEPLIAGNLEESGEALEQYPFVTRFEGVRRRHVIEYPNYRSRESLTKLLVDQVNVVKQALTDVTKEEINQNLFGALTRGYEGTVVGHMPLACRTLVGDKLAYRYNSNATLNAQLQAITPNNAFNAALLPDRTMNVTHIRRLRDMALFNEYGASKMGAGMLQGGVLPFDQTTRFIFLIDQNARDQLLSDEFFRATYLHNARTLPSDRLINPVALGDYMGTVFGVDVYYCPYIDLYRKEGVMLSNVPLGVSYGVFLAASALVEGYGFTDLIETVENRGGKRIELQYEYVHGAEAPRFPGYFSGKFKETDARDEALITENNANIPTFEHNPNLRYSMPEVGIIHSFTWNKVMANWTV